MKRYSLKQLYDLWILWLDEAGVNAQEMFRITGLKESFVLWLERRERR